jgi:thioesterase domain-containing protein
MKPAWLAIATMAHSGLDYEFFSILSQRIDNASGEEKQKLAALRERLLQLTKEIEQHLQQQAQRSRELLDGILRAEDIEQAATEALPEMDEFFADKLRNELQQAHRPEIWNVSRSCKKCSTSSRMPRRPTRSCPGRRAGWR